MKILISGSIVLYKNDSTIKKTIRSFLSTALDVKLLLVDNSPDETLRLELSEFKSDPRVKYIFNNKNIGFGAAHNIAIRQMIDVSKYHLVLNPDVSFAPGVLEELSSYMDRNTAVGLVIPKVLYPDGKVQYSCKLLPTPADLIFRRFLPSSLSIKRTEYFEMRCTGYSKEMEVPYLSGCFMFLRIEALKKVGLFDERFFMYPEDIDLTRRMHREYKTMFYPKVSIVHEHGQGSYKSKRLLYIHIINMIKYFNKWGWLFDRERKIVNRKILLQFEKT